jgi:hypothetical protein
MEEPFFDWKKNSVLKGLSEIFEKEYHGYISDTELVQAIDRLFNISDTTPPYENISDSQMLPEITQSTFIIQSNQVNLCQDEGSGEYY